MYPRNSDRRGYGSPAGLWRRREMRGEGANGEVVTGGRETRIYVAGYIAERYQSVEGGKKREVEGNGACTKGTPTVPSRSFTPTGAYTLPPPPRICGYHAATARCQARRILHSPLFASCTPKRELGTRRLPRIGRDIRREQARGAQRQKLQEPGALKGSKRRRTHLFSGQTRSSLSACSQRESGALLEESACSEMSAAISTRWSRRISIQLMTILSCCVLVG